MLISHNAEDIGFITRQSTENHTNTTCGDHTVAHNVLVNSNRHV